MEFSRALEEIRMSPIVTISEEAGVRAKEYEKCGEPFIRFQRGDIDLPTPAYIREAVARGLKKGLTKYPKSGGEKFFREAVVAKLKSDHGIADLDPANVVATYGGQEALELSFKLFASGAGFSPTWSCALENFVPYAQIPFTEIPLREDFGVDYGLLERELKGKDFFYLNNPQNPTGKVFTRDELEKIVEICSRLGCYIIGDEAYDRIVYDGHKHVSLAEFPRENIITVFTFSKTYSMTGWRLGCAVTRNEKVARLLKLGNYTQTAGVTTFLQYAGAEALSNREESEKAIGAMVAEFQKRRDALYAGLEGLPGVKLPGKPQGAFYIFPNFTEAIPEELTGENREKYIYELLMRNGMASVYGSCFGKHFADNVRLSFSGTPVPVIEKGVERFRKIFSKAAARS